MCIQQGQRNRPPADKMGVFAMYCRVLRLLFGGNVVTIIVAVNLFIYAAGSSEMKSPPSFRLLLERGPGSLSPLSLTAAFPENVEITENCLEFLRVYGQRYDSLATCLVSYARPVRICQNCYSVYNSFLETYNNISSDKIGPGNVSCQESLIRADRLMLLYNLYSSITDIWDAAACAQCLSTNGLNNGTLNFLGSLNQSLSCFEKYQGNQTELCVDCKVLYKGLNELYSKAKNVCIDMEDAMNMTRHMWSKTFNCSVSREETVPVIAVSSFMLFLPVIFYLSNFLHSEQKKRKLIHPKRAKSNNSLMNIQDKFS